MKDTDLMPWGIHKGKEMQDVPASYPLYLYRQGKMSGPVLQYVEDNLEVLEFQTTGKQPK